MKKIIVASLALMCGSQAFALEGRYGGGFYEFASSEKNTKSQEMPMSIYKKGSLVFFRNDTAYMFYPQKNRDLDELIVCPELMSLNIEGTFAYDEANKKIYFVKKTSDGAAGTQMYEANEDGDKFTGVKLMKIQGVMAEKNQIKGSTLAMGRYNFSHPGAKGFHNPSLAERGKKILFSGEFKAGKGGRDLYFIEKIKDENGEEMWSRPAPISDTLNTEFVEDYPLVVGDTALIFTSNRPGGKGGMDLYAAHKRRNESIWNPAVNMGDVFNSSANDYNVVYNRRSMYFLSDRAGGKKAGDIYYPEHYNFIFDKELAMDHTIEEPKGFNWVLFFFDYNKSDMKPEYEVQMDELFSAMQEYPGFSFQVTGYTDSRGSEDYNKKLSQKRADYIREMLINKGLNPKKIKSVGKGMADPVVPNAETEEEHEQNRRVEIKLLND